MFSYRMEIGIYEIFENRQVFNPFSRFLYVHRVLSNDICSHKKCQYRIIISWKIEIIEKINVKFYVET